MNISFKLKCAFTLAEVLITLGIIGIVAAVTIPVLMNSIQDNNYKVAYKTAYSLASRAWLSAYADNSLEPRNGWESNVSNYDNFIRFMEKFDVVTTCIQTGFSDCWANNETSGAMYNLPFSQDGNTHELCFLDKSGRAWCNANTWGYMLVDTNGFKPPNKYGLDRFRFNSNIHGGTAGVPDSLFPSNNDITSKDDTSCPNGNNHPCYYNSWLYN